MERYCTHIDEQGFVIAGRLFTDEEIANFDGILLIGVEPPSGVDMPIKPRWDGQRWVDGATQTDIDEYNASQSVEMQPSDIDILREENEQLRSSLADLWEVVLLGGAE